MSEDCNHGDHTYEWTLEAVKRSSVGMDPEEELVGFEASRKSRSRSKFHLARLVFGVRCSRPPRFVRRRFWKIQWEDELGLPCHLGLIDVTSTR
jgi:hypothetical protein